MRPAGSPQALGRRRQGFAARAADFQLRGGVFVPPPARRGAAFAPLRLDCGRGVCPPPARLRARRLSPSGSARHAAFAPLRLDGARRLPPSGSTAGSALSPTPPQGGSDTGAPYASLISLPPGGGVAEAEPPGWVRPVLRCRPIPTPFIPDPPLRPAPPPDPSRVRREPLPRRKARRRSGPPAPGNGSAPPAGIRRCAASGR